MQERSIQILFGLCQHGFGPQWFRGRATRARVEGWLSIKRVPSETRELSRSPLMMTNRAFQPEAVEALAAVDTPRVIAEARAALAGVRERTKWR